MAVPVVFFEGWYFRDDAAAEPEQTFAFMYSIEDPTGGRPAVAARLRF